MTMPKRCGMPQLTCNTEGLRKHNFLLVFVPETHITHVQRKWRTWLLHCLVSAVRHYNEARETILKQLDAGSLHPDASVFYILDFSEHMEDCMASVYRTCMCGKKLAASSEDFSKFYESNRAAIEQLRKIRNQHEHMHTQIASGEVGDGPIILCLDDEGDSMRFRDMKMSLADLHGLIEGIYAALVPMFSGWDGMSAPEQKGVAKLTMTAKVG